MTRDTEGPAFDAAGVQRMRGYWFEYLDTVEAWQGALHGYCVKLTGNVWDAEDLVQDTLLRGFAMSARGDFHGEASPVRDARAYLFRTATNLWLDQQRRRRWQVATSDGAIDPAAADPTDPALLADALGRAATLTTAREFAAWLLKDGYAFTLDEIADFIGTTTGTVKSALSRARGKLRQQSHVPAVDPRVGTLVRAFVDAMSSGDAERVLGLMAETVKIDVCNVGGGRGRSPLWTRHTLQGFLFDYAEHAGKPLVLLLDEGDTSVLAGALQVEGDGGLATRIVDYHYAADTLRLLANDLGLDVTRRGYHQGRQVIAQMLATTGLPWRV